MQHSKNMFYFLFCSFFSCVHAQKTLTTYIDNKTIVTAEDNTLRVFTQNKGRLNPIQIITFTENECQETIEGHAAPIRDISYNQRFKLLVSIDKNGTIIVWGIKKISDTLRLFQAQRIKSGIKRPDIIVWSFTECVFTIHSHYKPTETRFSFNKQKNRFIKQKDPSHLFYDQFKKLFLGNPPRPIAHKKTLFKRNIDQVKKTGRSRSH